jgi:hypothetical protein
MHWIMKELADHREFFWQLDSIIVIMSHSKLDSPAFESCWGQYIPCHPDWPANHPSCTMGIRFFVWVMWPDYLLTSCLLLIPGCKWVGTILPSSLYACISLSWGDQYLYSAFWVCITPDFVTVHKNVQDYLLVSSILFK